MMTKHIIFQEIDKRSDKKYTDTLTSLYSEKLSNIYKLRFTYVNELICLTKEAREMFYLQHRTIYLPFIINNVKVSIKPLIWN